MCPKRCRSPPCKPCHAKLEIFVRMPKLQTHAGSSIQLRLSRCFSASTSAASSPVNSRPNRCLLPGCTNHVCCPVLFSGRVALDQCLPRKNSARAPHSAWSGSVARPSLSGRPQRTMSCAYWMLRGRGQSKFSAPFELNYMLSRLQQLQGWPPLHAG